MHVGSTRRKAYRPVWYLRSKQWLTYRPGGESSSIRLLEGSIKCPDDSLFKDRNIFRERMVHLIQILDQWMMKECGISSEVEIRFYQRSHVPDKSFTSQGSFELQLPAFVPAPFSQHPQHTVITTSGGIYLRSLVPPQTRRRWLSTLQAFSLFNRPSSSKGRRQHTRCRALRNTCWCLCQDMRCSKPRGS